jgi:hypothetical protein
MLVSIPIFTEVCDHTFFDTLGLFQVQSYAHVTDHAQFNSVVQKVDVPLPLEVLVVGGHVFVEIVQILSQVLRGLEVLSVDKSGLWNL